MRRAIKYIFVAILTTLTLYACSVKKYIPKDEFLYRGAEIHLKDTVDSEDNSDIISELEEVLYPEPNSKLLGGYPALYFHYKNEKENPGFINRFLFKKLGEEPAYFSTVNLENTEDLLRNRLENNGFFYGDVGYKVKKDTSKKTAKVDYTVNVKKPYRMKSLKIENEGGDTIALYDQLKKSLAETNLKEGDRFSLNNFKGERERIDTYLKDKGYYFFNKDFLLFQADTNRYDDKGFDLYLKMKEGTPEKSKVPYVIDSVEVYTSVYNDTVYGKQDTITIDNVTIIQSEQNPFFKPKRLRPFILLEPGQRYNPENSRFTSRRLTSIGSYKFVNIQYDELDTITDDKGKRHLKSEISLSPLPRNSLQLRLQGLTKSNGFTGPGIAANYKNRNIFGGGEDFNIDANFGYEKQLSSESSGSQSIQLGLKASLLFPRLLFPWKLDHVFRYDIPKTKISAGIDFLDRSHLYKLNSVSTSFGYIWRQNRFVTHNFHLLKADYVNLGHTSDRFEEALEENPFLKRSFEQQFIAGIDYSFTFNELNEPEKGRFYLQFNVDLAGNIPDLLGERIGDGTKKFLGLRYAQYAKADVDLSYHYRLNDKGHSLVGHLFAGMGVPYGNSKSLPFVKQYFAGGPYSIRAFRIRGLGPGTYKPEKESDSYFDQAGDIRLEANVEYRFPIISFLKGAVFADAGNVWLKNGNEALPGGKFSSSFINELGIGTGVGLRVDVQGFVIRFDLSSAVKRPTGSWKFEYDRPMFNFGIGYPF